MLPSEFKKIWSDLSQKLMDNFMDFFDCPILTINLIQELVLVCQEVQKKYFDLTIDSIGEFLKIPSNKRNGLESYIKVLFKEYSNFIYDNEQSTILFTKQIKEIYIDRVSTFDNFVRKDDIEDIIQSKYFTELIVILKKILLYIEVHDPPLTFKIESYLTRKVEKKSFKNAEFVCIDGFAKENKNCFLILNPPLLRNNYVYQGLKSIVIINDEYDKIYTENKQQLCSIELGVVEDETPNKLDIPELKIKNNSYYSIKTNLSKDNLGLEKNFSKQEIKLINRNLTQFLLYSGNEVVTSSNNVKEVKNR